MAHFLRRVAAGVLGVISLLALVSLPGTATEPLADLSRGILLFLLALSFRVALGDADQVSAALGSLRLFVSMRRSPKLAAGLPRQRWIVARGSMAHSDMIQQIPGADVIIDRRVGERRRDSCTPSLERRRIERRVHDISKELRETGYARL